MKAFLSSLVYDPLGFIEIDALDDLGGLGDTQRRVNRIPTLDGGAAVNDFGHSYADGTLSISFDAENENLVFLVDRLVRLYARLVVSVPTGCFLVAPERLIRGNDAHQVVLLILEKLD